jgi:hypothetical protein
MQEKVFHVYRNTPIGRETLMQAIDLCKKSSADLYIYSPQHDRFMIYFDADAVEVHLDQSYLHSPGTQKNNLDSILEAQRFVAKNVYSSTKTGSTLPDISTNFDLINLPKIMTELKKGLTGSNIGPGVRRLIKASHAPALISPNRFVDWSSIHLFFGGSRHAEKALRWALLLSRESKKPLHLTTLLEKKNESFYRDKIKKMNILPGRIASWTFWEQDSLFDALFKVERDQLIVMGAYGKSGLKKRLLGGTTEMVLRNSANPLLLVGENCSEPQLED